MSKNYSEKILEIKNDVLDEIREILGTDERHKFADPFFVHYVDEEVATTEICLAVEVWHEGQVVFCTGESVCTPRDQEAVIEGCTVYKYDPDSFFDILDNLRKEVREEKLQTLRELVKKAGDEINFDGNFKFTGETEIGDCENTTLYGLSINDNGELLIDDSWKGDEYTNTEEYIKSSELDRIIEYVRKQTEKPEERLALTDEQKAIVERIKRDIALLSRTGGTIMLDQDYGKIFAVNTKDEEFNLYGSDNEHQTRVDISKLPQDSVIGDGYVCYSSESIYLT